MLDQLPAVERWTSRYSPAAGVAIGALFSLLVSGRRNESGAGFRRTPGDGPGRSGRCERLAAANAREAAGVPSAITAGGVPVLLAAPECPPYFGEVNSTAR
jgi:hypothetical protein